MTDSSTEKAQAEKLARNITYMVHPWAYLGWVEQAEKRALPVATLLVQVGEALQGELSPGRSDCNDRRCGACSRCRSRAALSAYEALMKEAK